MDTFMNQMDRTFTSTENGAMAIGQSGVCAPMINQTRSGLFQVSAIKNVDVVTQLVSIWDKCIQGVGRETIEQFVNTACTALEKQDMALQQRQKLTVWLITLCFQTRDCRGQSGKGFRQGGYLLFLSLYKSFPNTMNLALKLFPEVYGSWLDLREMQRIMDLDVKNGRVPANNGMYLVIHQQFVTMWYNQIVKDNGALMTGKMPSLAAKWLQSEKSEKRGKRYVKVKGRPTLSEEIAKLMFGNANNGNDEGTKRTRHLKKKKKSYAHKKKFRHLITKLRKALKVPEVNMANKTWSDIKSIPSRCAFKKKKAFLNELRGTSNVGKLRYPNSKDRMQCRDNFLKMVKSGKVKGGQTYIHEIVKSLYRSNLSEGVKTTMQSMWDDKMLTFLNQFSAASHASEQPPRMIVIADVSGSMEGTPMMVSIAMGLFFAEANKKLNSKFGDRFITFHESPSWVQVYSELSLYERVQVARNSPWGGSTDFIASMEMLIKVGKNNHLKSADFPSVILCVSDMDFNTARYQGSNYQTLNKIPGKTGKFFSSIRRSSDYDTTHRMLKQAFCDAGIAYSSDGQPWEMPMMVYMNVRGKGTGSNITFPVQANEFGAIMISGFNPNILTAIMTGSFDKMEATECKRPQNTLETMEKVLEDERYDAVRKVIEIGQEKWMCGYTAPLTIVKDMAEIEI